jgi:hypothetical protein
MKSMAKRTVGLSGLAAALILGLLMSGCSNLFNEKPRGAEDGAGYVLVKLGLDDPDARTALPSPGELYYTLSYVEISPGSRSGEIVLGMVSTGGKTVSIPTGTWDLTIRAYRNPIDAQDPLLKVAEGSLPGVAIITGPNDPITINLGAAQSGSGTLRYSLSYPSSPTVTSISMKLEEIGGTTRTIALATSSGTSTSGQVPGLGWGYYQVDFFLRYNNRTAVKGDLVHIYQDMETPVSFTFAAEDFAYPPDGIDDLQSAMEAALTARERVAVSTTSGADVHISRHWVTSTVMTNLNTAIGAAEKILAAYGVGSTATEISAVETGLNGAAAAFNSAKALGTYDPAVNAPNLGLFDSVNTRLAGTTLASSLEWLRDNNASITDNTAYTIKIGADETLPPWILGGASSETGTTTAITGKSGITLTITGSAADLELSLSGPGSLFTLNSGITLVLGQNITLRGLPDNTTPLVRVNTSGVFSMEAGSKISDNTASSSGGGVYVEYGTFTMNGGEISGNTASSSGGGVYVNTTNGTFIMNGGKISGNTASSYGGGVSVGGTFTMTGGEISGNTSSSGGGGVYVVSGTFTMTGGGKISGNNASGGGGVYVLLGSFTMSGGEISGNNASSGGGVSVSSSGSFTMSGAARVNLNNSVYLYYTTSFITIAAGGLTGTDPAALVEPALNPDFIGKPVLKWEGGGSGALPVARFKFAGDWTVNNDGILGFSSLPLTAPGETAGAYLSKGSVHFYKFSPVVNENYRLIRTGDSGSSTAAAWADGSGTLVTSSNTYFNANKPDLDIVIMVYGTGEYTVTYEQQ